MTSTLTDFPFAPVKQIHQCLHAFHVPAQDRTTFVESYHYCSHARDGMHQCVIYDSKEPDARLLGVEYIITEERFRGESATRVTRHLDSAKDKRCLQRYRVKRSRTGTRTNGK
jgi:Protein of unknown function (DUF1264)